MRKSKNILNLVFGAILLVVLAVFAYFAYALSGLSSPYLRFMDKDATYYSKVAQACDLVLRQHPVSSNDTVKLYERMILPYTIELSGRDESLPKILRALHPDSILVSSNRVFIDIPPERMGGFALIWEPMGSNYWILESNADGLSTVVVYRESKLFIPSKSTLEPTATVR